MFFREKNNRGSKNPSLQLVENHRCGDKVKQKVVTSLGVDFKIPKETRKKVAAIVERKLLGQAILFEESEENVVADRIVKKIQTTGGWSGIENKIIKDNPIFEGGSDNEAVAEVLVDKVDHSHGRSLGSLLAGHTFWERLGFPEILAELGFNGAQIRTAEISVLNRLISQGSENSIPGWIKTAAVEDIIDPKAEEFAEDRFYRISDKLVKHVKPIEEALYRGEQNLFGLDNAVYLYDLTNTYFEGLCEKNPKAEFCKNQKEKRTDCRQIVIALVLDQEGFIRRHHIFNGKKSDSKSLGSILESLDKDFENEDKPTIIMDRGIVSEDNINLVKSKHMKYVIASREGEELEHLEDFKLAEFKILKEDKKNKIEISKKEGGKETLLFCKSKQKKAKEEGMRNRAEKRLLEDIDKLIKAVETGGQIQPSVVERRIGRINERHAKVSHYYEMKYRPYSFDYHIPENETVNKRLLNSLVKLKEKADEYKISHLKVKSRLKELSGKYEADYRMVSVDLQDPFFSGKPKGEKKENLSGLDGNYLLKTDRDDLSGEQIWNMYVMLTRIEAAFRNLKTDLGLRPNYHHLENRVDGHVFITILAYHILHSIEYTLRENGCHSSWKTINRVLSSHGYSTIVMPTTKGTVIHRRKAGLPEPVHCDVYRKLNVDYENLPVRKLEV